MLVDVLLVVDSYDGREMPFTRIYVVDQKWILRIINENYEKGTEDVSYSFEDTDEATKRILLYLKALDSEERTLHVYQDDLELLNGLDDSLDMTVDRYWF